MKDDGRTRMVAAIYGSIMSTFRNEDALKEFDYHYDLSEVNLGDILINSVMALNFLYGELSGNEITNLEFTHLLNGLIVEFLLEKEGIEFQSKLEIKKDL